MQIMFPGYDVIFHHDNVTSHTAGIGSEWLEDEENFYCAKLSGIKPKQVSIGPTRSDYLLYGFYPSHNPIGCQVNCSQHGCNTLDTAETPCGNFSNPH